MSIKTRIRLIFLIDIYKYIIMKSFTENHKKLYKSL